MTPEEIARDTGADEMLVMEGLDLADMQPSELVADFVDLLSVPLSRRGEAAVRRYLAEIGEPS